MSKSKGKPYHPDYDLRAEPLVKACADGNLKKARQLVEAGAPVNAIGHKRVGYYPIHSAAENGHDDVVKYLIRVGAKLEVRTAAEYERKLYTPLNLAAQKNHFPTVKTLVEKGADVNAHSAHNNTPLGWAIQRRNREMFDYLFAHGARAEIADFNLAVSCGDKDLVQWFLDRGFKLDAEEFEMGQSHVVTALLHKNLEMVKFLVQHGANVNRASGDFAEPPLVQATRCAEWETARYLIEHGADPNLGSIHKAYPLNYAARRGGLECAALLLEKGAKANSVDFEDMTPLDWAVEEKDKPMLELLIEHGAVVPRKLVPTIIRRFTKKVLEGARVADNSPEKDIWLAAKEGDLSAIQRLVSAGVDVNAVKASGELREYKPLHIAAEYDRSEAVKELLKAGAEVDGRMGEGRSTPLMMAVGAGVSNATIEALLESGAEIDALDGIDSTALDVAAMEANERIVALLLARGAKAHQWKDGERPVNTLAQAVHGKNARVLEQLLRAGANVGKSGDRIPALLAATFEARADFVKRLLKAGADPNTQDADGFPSIISAVRGNSLEGGSLKALKLLIEAGADVNAIGPERETALDVAYEIRRKDMIELLEQCGGIARKRKRPKTLR